MPRTLTVETFFRWSLGPERKIISFHHHPLRRFDELPDIRMAELALRVEYKHLGSERWETPTGSMELVTAFGDSLQYTNTGTDCHILRILMLPPHLHWVSSA